MSTYRVTIDPNLCSGFGLASIWPRRSFGSRQEAWRRRSRGDVRPRSARRGRRLPDGRDPRREEALAA